MWFHFRFEVVAVLRLYFTSDFQWNARTLRYFDGQVGAFDWSDASDKTQVILLICLQVVLREINSVVNRVEFR